MNRLELRARRGLRWLAVLVLVTGLHGRTQASLAPTPRPAGPRTESMPLVFVPNLGQSDPAVRFRARGMGGAVFFTRSEVVLALPQPRTGSLTAGRHLAGDPRERALGAGEGVPVKFVRIRQIGAAPAPEVVGDARLPGSSHEFVGSDPKGWRAHLPSFGAVVYRQIHPGVDLHYDGTDGQLKATYTVAPGTDPSVIRWRYDGARTASVDTAGNLRLALTTDARQASDPARQLTEHAPVAWQEVAGRRQPVEIRYTVSADGTVGFALPNGYDKAQPLTLDPTLTYSTFLGGGGDDSAYDVAVDASGATYVVGRTLSVDFPVGGAVDPGCGTDGFCDGFGFYDAFVTKLNTSAVGAASLVFSTYLGGSANDFGLRVRIRNGVTGGPQIYLVGVARDGFPTTSNAYDQTYGSPPAVPVGADAFFAVLAGDGSQLVYSTYLGGGNGDGAWGLDIEPNGSAAIVGQTFSTDFPLVGALDSSCGTDGTCDTDQSDAFVARLDPGIAGSAGLLYATYLGGSGSDQAYGVARDAQGRLHVAGRTPSTDFPTTAGAFQLANGVPGGPRPGTCFAFENECDAFVSVLNATGSALAYSTYFGGSGYEDAYSLALDASGKTHIVGTTFSSNLSTTTNAFQPTFGGTNDAYLARLDPSANGSASLLYSSFFGGSDDDEGYGLALNGALAHVAGFTRSTDLPTSGNPFQPQNGGYWDAFALKLNPTLAGNAGLVYSTYLGGLSTDAGYAMAVEASGAMTVAGQAYSVNFPVTGAYQSLPVAGSDVIVARIDNATTSADLSVAQSDAPDPVALFSEITYTITVTNAGPNTATGVRLVDIVPPGTSFTYEPSQGTCREDFSTGESDLGCELGSLASGASATLTLRVTPFSEGTVTNSVHAFSNLSDPNGSNNSASASTTVVTPALAIGDATVTEGNAGTTNAVFTVSLSPPSAQTVFVDYATANGTATAGDYTSGTATLTFAPGITTLPVSVPVIGDTAVEPNETFFVNLGSPSGANITDGQGQGTILNDDSAPGSSLSVSTTTATPGQTIQVTVANGPGNPKDWVGLHATAAADTQLLDWKYLNGTRTSPVTGLTGATFSFTAPTTPGTYNFRFFQNNTYTKLATSATVTVAAGTTPTLSVSTTTATPGQTIQVTVANGPGNPNDWVGLHATPAPDTQLLDWKFLNGTRTAPVSGLTGATFSFTLPMTPGTFNFRFFRNNTYTKLATSATVTVAAGTTPTLGVSTTTATPGQTIQVTVANGPGNPKDWVGLHATAGTDMQLLDWNYLNGIRTAPVTGATGATISFTLPTTPGTYNFRFFQNNTYTKLATSATVTVAAGTTPTLSPSTTTATPGQTIQVTVANGPGNPKDWVGLHATSATDTQLLDWKYLNGTRTAPLTGATGGTVSFTLPTTPGTYNFRFFQNNGYTKLATSATVTVQ